MIQMTIWEKKLDFTSDTNVIGSKDRAKVMNEAERQYKQYVKIFARTCGTTIEEATETRMCKEYKKYCEEVFGVGIPDETSNG